MQSQKKPLANTRCKMAETALLILKWFEMSEKSEVVEHDPFITKRHFLNFSDKNQSTGICFFRDPELWHHINWTKERKSTFGRKKMYYCLLISLVIALVEELGEQIILHESFEKRLPSFPDLTTRDFFLGRYLIHNEYVTLQVNIAGPVTTKNRCMR